MSDAPREPAIHPPDPVAAPKAAEAQAPPLLPEPPARFLPASVRRICLFLCATWAIFHAIALLTRIWLYPDLRIQSPGLLIGIEIVRLLCLVLLFFPQRCARWLALIPFISIADESCRDVFSRLLRETITLNNPLVVFTRADVQENLWILCSLVSLIAIVLVVVDDIRQMYRQRPIQPPPAEQAWPPKPRPGSALDPQHWQFWRERLYPIGATATAVGVLLFHWWFWSAGHRFEYLLQPALLLQSHDYVASLLGDVETGLVLVFLLLPKNRWRGLALLYAAGALFQSIVGCIEEMEAYSHYSNDPYFYPSYFHHWSKLFRGSRQYSIFDLHAVDTGLLAIFAIGLACTLAALIHWLRRFPQQPRPRIEPQRHHDPAEFHVEAGWDQSQPPTT